MDIRVGDFVRLKQEGRLVAWSRGHVVRVDDKGRPMIAFGGRDMHRSLCALGPFPSFTPLKLVSEVWRRVRVEKNEEPFEFEGKMVTVHSSDYEWVKVYDREEEVQ
jgi:hypothetical protein